MRALISFLLLAACSAAVAQVQTLAPERRAPDETELRDGVLPGDERLHPSSECLRRDVNCVIVDLPAPPPRVRDGADLPPPIFVPEQTPPQPSAPLSAPRQGTGIGSSPSNDGNGTGDAQPGGSLPLAGGGIGATGTGQTGQQGSSSRSISGPRSGSLGGR